MNSIRNLIHIVFFSFTLISIKATASVDFKNHIDMAANQKLNMNSRWTSLIKAADYAKKDQVEDIQKFSSNKEWYMRNATLVALSKIDPLVATVAAQKLVKDKALVVRSAAVEILSRDMTEANKRILVDEMDQSYNFNNKSSLWIRHQILENIAKQATLADRDIFVKNLFDKDRKISELSAHTLEKITGTKLKTKKFVENWQALAKEKLWL